MKIQGPRRSSNTATGVVYSLGFIALAALAGLFAFGGFATSAQAQTAPTLAATGVLDAPFVENQPAGVLPLYSGATATTGDPLQSFTGMTVEVQNSPDGNSERLLFGSTSIQFTATTVVDGAVTATAMRPTLTSATVQFTFAPALTQLEFEAFVGTLGYRHFGNDISDGVRNISIPVILDSGGDIGVGDAVASVAVSAVNDPPFLSSLPASVSVVEGVASDVDLSASAYGDVDGRSGDQTLTITASAGTLSGVTAGGVTASAPGISLTLTGPSTLISSYMNTASNIQYTSPPGATAETLTFDANDNGNTGTADPTRPFVAPDPVNIIVGPPPATNTLCLSTAVGQGATDSGFTAADITATVQSAMAMVASIDNGACSDTSAAAYPIAVGAQFAVLQTTPEGLGFLSLVCDGITQSVGIPIDSPGEPIEPPINCTLTNDSIVLCAIKLLGPTATALSQLDPPQFSETDAGFSLNGGPVQTPGPACSLAPAVQFAVAPGVTFTLAETLPAGSIVAPTEIVCRRFDAVGSMRNEAGTVDLVAGSIIVDTGASLDRTECIFTNDAASVCVYKQVGSNATAAGFTPDQFSFNLVPTTGQAVVLPGFCTSESTSSARLGTGFAIARGAGFTVTEDDSAVPAGAAIGLVGNPSCFSNGASVMGDRTAKQVTVPASTDLSRQCDFFNEATQVTINKTVINDDGGTLAVGDFVFDVFDGDGGLVATVSDTDAGPAGAVVYVAPESSFTVTERAVAGYTTTASCESGGDDQALEATSVSYDLMLFDTSLNCTFVNDDIAEVPVTPVPVVNVPVCIMFSFEEGTSGLTLADFTLELFDGGAVVGSRFASSPTDAVCTTTTTTANADGSTTSSSNLLPSAVISLGAVPADGRTVNVMASVNDPAGVVQFGATTCTAEPAAGSTQTIRSGPSAAVTVPVGTTRVSCTGFADTVTPAVAPVVGIGVMVTAAEPDPTPTGVAAAAPLPVQAVQVTPLAVTGASTSDTGLPLALALFGTGFAVLAAHHLRRKREDEF